MEKAYTAINTNGSRATVEIIPAYRGNDATLADTPQNVDPVQNPATCSPGTPSKPAGFTISKPILYGSLALLLFLLLRK